MKLTLIQAQDRYIRAVLTCHPGHARRVAGAAWRRLYKWAESHGFDPKIVCQDAKDMAQLENEAEN